MSSNQWNRVGRAAVRNAGCALALLLAVAPVSAHEVDEAVATKPEFPQQQSAGDLLRACASSRMTAAGRERRRYCAGFVSGVEEAVRLLGSGQAAEVRLCTPADVTAAALADAFVRYGASHEGELDQPAAGVVLYALAAAYPCPGGGD
ncbi:MAG: Rap1a/Tai family immunity protein [Xanthomonadales bacterium]